MPLYGHELSESINPYAAGVGWAVKLDKGEFAGKSALTAYKAAPGRARVGLKLEAKRIARQGAVVYSGDRAGGRGDLGNVLADAASEPGDGAGRSRRGGGRHRALTVDVRGHREPAGVVKLPFYKRPRATARTG